MRVILKIGLCKVDAAFVEREGFVLYTVEPIQRRPHFHHLAMAAFEKSRWLADPRAINLTLNYL